MASYSCPQCGKSISPKDACEFCGYLMKNFGDQVLSISEKKTGLFPKKFYFHFYLTLVAGLILVFILFKLPRHVIDTNRNLTSSRTSDKKNSSPEEPQSLSKV